MLEIEKGVFDYAKTFPKSKKLHLFGQVQQSNLTVALALQNFLDQKARVDRASSVAGYKKAAAHFDSLGILPIRELNSKHIRDWIKSQTTAPKTVRNRLSVLRGAVNSAMADGLLTHDPFALVKVDDLVPKTKSKSYDINPFSLSEIKQIVQTAEPPLAYNIQLAFFSGLRTGELLGLKWQDVDLVGGWLHISGSVVEGSFEENVKTQTSNRQVKLLPLAKEALEKIQVMNQLKEREPEFVCLTQFGKRYSSDKSWNSSWRHVFDKLTVPYRNPYQTRHTFASLLLMQGEPVTWVADQLGHKNLSMVIMRYGRWVKAETNQYEPTAKLYQQGEL
jgi:integrase